MRPFSDVKGHLLHSRPISHLDSLLVRKNTFVALECQLNICAGTDISVCVVLAALLCCFTEPDEKGSCTFKPYCGQHLIHASREVDLIGAIKKPGAGGNALDELASDADFAVQNPLNHHERLNSDPPVRPFTAGLRPCGKIASKSQEQDEDGLVSKAAMRKRLAYLSSFYPVANPSRGNLKQVFSFARMYFPNL